MSLTAGTKLGPYEIVCAIGAGGMGSACGRGERATRAEPQRVGVPAFAKATAGPPKLGASLRAEAGGPHEPLKKERSLASCR